MEDKYKVHQLIRLHGNPIFAGVYDASELPDSIKQNAALCTKIDPQTPPTANYKSGITTQEITVGTKTPTQGKESFTPKKPIDIDAQEKEKAEQNKDKVSILNINTATVDQLSSIDGITVSTAQEVIAEREKTKFASFQDLDKRVSLKGNRKWSTYSDRITV